MTYYLGALRNTKMFNPINILKYFQVYWKVYYHSLLKLLLNNMTTYALSTKRFWQPNCTKMLVVGEIMYMFYVKTF